VSIVFRICGGAPGQRVERTVALAGSGAVRARIRDDWSHDDEGDGRADLDRETLLEAARLVGRGLEELIPAAEARFVPDSVIGSVTVGIGEESETYFFDASEDEPTAMGKLLAAPARGMVTRFQEIAKQCVCHAPDRQGKEDAR